MAKIKRALMWLVGFLVAVVGVFLFVALVYLVEELHDAGKPIFAYMNNKGFDGGGPFEVAVIVWGLVAAAFLISCLQFFKSLFDQSIKKYCDQGAVALLDKFEKWINK